MRLKSRLMLSLSVMMLVLAQALPAAGAIDGNTLSLNSSSAPAGETASITLQLANEDVISGIQADIVFDSQVVAFSSLTVQDRAVDMVAEGRVVSAGRLRVVLYFDDSGSLVSDEGILASLAFTMLGSTDDATSLVFEDIILSNPAGNPLVGSGDSGQLTVLAPENPPVVTLSVLKNPGNTRIVSIMVTVTGGSGNLPTVMVGSVAVAMTSLGEGVFEGQNFVPASTTSTTFSASDTNANGTETQQVSLSFP